MTFAAVHPPARVLVTGSAGFIGRHLVRHLISSGYHVHGLDYKESDWRHERYAESMGDLCDADWLAGIVRDVDPVAILHLAARTDLDETRHVAGYAVNTEGVSNLIVAVASSAGVRRVICTSSQLVCRNGYVPSHAEDYRPSTVYGASKVETEQRWRRADGAGRSWCIVRPTTIWGPGMNPHYLTFFSMLRDGRYFHVSGGNIAKSYGYVGNTVHQYQKLLEAPHETIHRRTFYLADHPPISLQEWAEAFRTSLDAPKIRTLPRSIARVLAIVGDGVQAVSVRKFPFTSFRLSNVLTPSIVDLSGIVEICGLPPVPLEAGVTMTTAWLRRVWSGAGRWAID